MKVKVRLFAKFREIAGTEFLLLDASTVGELKRRLSEILNVEESRINIIIDGDRAPDDHELKEGEEALAFPPVAGGFELISFSEPSALVKAPNTFTKLSVTE